MLDFLFGMIWKDLEGFQIQYLVLPTSTRNLYIERLQSIKRKFNCYVENNLVALKFIHN